MQQAILSKISPGISVVGKGTADVAPEVLRLTVTTETIHNSAERAQAESDRAMDQIFKTLSDAGIDAKDIATLGYRVGPTYEERGLLDELRGTRKGFKASNTILVTLRDLNEAGRIMDLVVKAGATSLELDYDYTVPEETRALARQRAVANAQAKACHLAQLAEVELGETLQINEVEHLWHFREARLATEVFGAPAGRRPLVRPSDLRIEVTVEMTYQIKRD